MAYKKNGGHGGPVDFRDGQPVFRGEGGGRGGYSKRGEGSGKAPAGKAPFKSGAPKRYNDDKPEGGDRPERARYGAPRGDRFHKDSQAEGEKRYGEKKRYGEDKRANGADKTEYPFKTASEQEQERGANKYGERRSERYGDKRYGNKRSSDSRDERGDERGTERYGERRNERFSDRRPLPSREETAPAVNEDELPYILMGRNAVKEALKSGRSIDRILVQNEPDGSLREILALARENNVQYREVDRAKLDEMCMPFGHGRKTGNHQGIVAQVPGVQYCEIADILDAAKEKDEKPFVIVLDGIEDPHNLGSIIRSAECAGAHGVIIPKRRATGVTASACKASAGAVEYIKVCQVANLSGALARLKDAGLWIAGADMSGQPMEKADLKGALALVIGNEGKGISELVKKNCDFLVSIPMKGQIGSLNASVAAAVLMYEKLGREAR